MSDAIDVDVARSFTQMLSLIPQTTLSSILKAYAQHNPALIDYCQGMNFVAGFLFLFFEKESLAYAVMKELIIRFRMHETLNQGLPLLKLHFYQLDRLISILLPDLHTHFKVSAM